MAPPLALTPCSKAYPPPSDRRATASCGGVLSCSCGSRGCRGDGESPGPLESFRRSPSGAELGARGPHGEGHDLGPLSPQPPPAAPARCMSGTVVFPTRGARLRRTDALHLPKAFERAGGGVRAKPRGAEGLVHPAPGPWVVGVCSASGAWPPEVKDPRGRRGEPVASSPGTDAIQSGSRGFDVAPSLGWPVTRGAAVTVWPGPGGRRDPCLGGCRLAPRGPAYYLSRVPSKEGSGNSISPFPRLQFPQGEGVGSRVPGTEEPLLSSSVTLASPRGLRGSLSPAGLRSLTSVNLSAPHSARTRQG